MSRRLLKSGNPSGAYRQVSEHRRVASVKSVDRWNQRTEAQPPVGSHRPTPRATRLHTGDEGSFQKRCWINDTFNGENRLVACFAHTQNQVLVHVTTMCKRSEHGSRGMSLRL